MAGPVKISELPEATTGLVDGGIIIPVIQDGVTKRINLTNLLFPNSITSGRIAAAQVGTSEVSADLTTALTTSIASGIDVASIGAATASAVATAQAQADAALALANGKVQTFYQVATPTPTGIGDIWVNADTHQVFRSSDGISFNEALDIIVDGSITANKLQTNSITANQISAATINAIKISAQDIDVSQLRADVIDSIVINSDTIGVNTLIADNIKSNEIESDHLKSNIITAREIFAGSITANEIASGTITTNLLDANIITAREISACTITSTHLDSCTITTRHIAAGAVTSVNISSGSVGAGAIAAGVIGTAALEAGAILTGNLKSEDSDIQITTNANTGEYIFNLGTKGFYLHGPTGTIVANKLIARDDIITGSMVKFDETLSGLTTDLNGNIAVQTDDETLKIENGKVIIKEVPSNAVVNAYKDLNYLGAHNGKAHQTITATVANRLSRGLNVSYDGTDVGFMKIAVVDLLSFGNNINLGEIGAGSINNLTFEIDPRGFSQLGAFATGGNELELFVVARYASTNNITSGNSSIMQAGNFIAKPFGDLNPVIPNAPFEIEMKKLNLRAPENSVSRYLHVHTVFIAGHGDQTLGAVQINDTVTCGIKPSLNSYVSYEVTGDQTGIDLARPMTDFLNSTDGDGNVIGDYVAPSP